MTKMSSKEFPHDVVCPSTIQNFKKFVRVYGHDVTDCHGRSLLSAMCKSMENAEKYGKASNRVKECFKWLIDNTDVDVEQLDNDGYACWHHCADSLNIVLFEFLMGFINTTAVSDTLELVMELYPESHPAYDLSLEFIEKACDVEYNYKKGKRKR